MSSRELVVLGTSSHLPTRYRNHNGYFLRWESEGFLFDPGEGTQRQMTLAGLAANSITRICVTHLHGDHCLGLPGIIQRLSADRVEHPVDLYYPASGQAYIDRLRRASIFHETAELRLHPVYWDGEIGRGKGFALNARRLDHRVDSIGYQVVEDDGRRMVAPRLRDLGLHGPEVGQLLREGHLEKDGTHIDLADVSEDRPGQRFAFIMDTRACASARELADRADLLVCESTFLAQDEALAAEYGHMTAAGAARLASDAEAGQLVLTHFSQRYPDETSFEAEAAAIFADVIAARDLLVVPLRRRHGGSPHEGPPHEGPRPS